jgi:hypothetical protein
MPVTVQLDIIYAFSVFALVIAYVFIKTRKEHKGSDKEIV